MLMEYLYTCLILGLAHGNSNTLCMDCRERNMACPIQETGYSVISRRQDVAMKRLGRYAPLSKCLPLDLQINETEFDALCVWSPKLGCQVMINKFRTVQMFCKDCVPPFEPPNDGVKRCPCHGFSLIDSGSAGMCCGSLKYLMAFYFVQRLMLA